ncbi:MAG: carbamoyltransferase HypF [Deltaproteobacteria bacterium]|nr:carbamoyltransferase HypF [Deltaproteobacteria bacterium]
MSTNTQHRFDNESDFSESAFNVDLYGRVQGVGMRPWLFRLAQSHELLGQIFNHFAGTSAVLQGRAAALQSFQEELTSALSGPSGHFPAQVEKLVFSEIESRKFDRLEILTAPPVTTNHFFSQLTLSAPPDLATCFQCWLDFSNPKSRFFNYPFISCTSCGPRWTLLRKLPFEREHTSYADFEMCTDCEKEYSDPSSRRFFSQTMSCETCGPKIQLHLDSQQTLRENPPKNTLSKDAFRECSTALKAGKIGVIKGMGGFQLIGNALDEHAIMRIRALKQRPDQALAVMFRDLETFQFYGGGAQMWNELRSPEAAIHSTSGLEFPTRHLIAPDLNEAGAMAATTPFHFLLQSEVPLLVVTSANQNGSPIPRTIQEIEFRIGSEIDFVLDHNREITFPIDDSVVKDGQVLRAARGILPRVHPRKDNKAEPKKDVLALGADLKNSSAFTQNGITTELPYAGTISTLEGLRTLKSRLERQLKLFDFVPKAVLCDFHPETLTCQLNLFPDLVPTRVPHHLAHAMALQMPADLVLSFDGTGFNGDMDANGGEGFIQLERRLQFEPTPLVGGTSAVREPWKFATSSLIQGGMGRTEILKLFPNVDPAAFQTVVQLSKSHNQVKTTSVGRWFDAASAIVCFGTRNQTYEAQAPIRLESLAAKCRSPIAPLLFSTNEFISLGNHQSSEGATEFIQIAGSRLLTRLAELKISKLYQESELAFYAHDMLAQVVAKASARTLQQFGASSDSRLASYVGVTGGVFQNQVFLNCLETHMKEQGLNLRPTQGFPVNDQAIALGQTRWWHQCTN